jgi:hypothetical protein
MIASRTLDTGVVPRRVVVSRETATLVAADSRAARLSLVDVFSGKRRGWGICH